MINDNLILGLPMYVALFINKYDYSWCANEINCLNHWALIMKNACEYFLKDDDLQFFFDINKL